MFVCWLVGWLVGLLVGLFVFVLCLGWFFVREKIRKDLSVDPSNFDNANSNGSSIFPSESPLA